MTTTYKNNDFGRVKATNLPAIQRSETDEGSHPKRSETIKGSQNKRSCGVQVKAPPTQPFTREEHYIDYDNGLRVPCSKKAYEMMLVKVMDQAATVSKKLRSKKKNKNKKKIACAQSDEFIDTLCGLKQNKNRLYFDHQTSDFHFRNIRYDHWEAQSLLTDLAWTDCMSRANGVHSWLYDGAHRGQSFIEHYINVPSYLKSHINLVEDVCLMAHHLILSRNTFDRYIAIVNFCKLRGSRLGFTSTLICIASDLFRTCSSSEGSKTKYDGTYQNLEKDILDTMAYSPQAGEHDNIFAEARYYLGMYDKLKETAIYKKLYKFSLYVLSLGLLQGINIDFNSCNFSKFEADAIKRTHRPGVDMFHCMLDTVCFVCDRGLQYFKTGDPLTIFHTGASYENWICVSERLIRESRLMSNPEPHGICRFKYLNDLKESIEKGKSISKFTVGLEKYERMTIQRLLNELQLCESAEITRKSAQEPRKDPFGILIHGASSICKSQLKQILFYHYGKVFNLPTSADYMYTRCPTDEFWSGFNSTQWCIVMDDIAFLRPNNEVDPTLKELLQVKNSVAYVPPQADLCDKGRTPIRAELVIGTTNCKHLNLHSYFSCPFAVARRMSYVVTAKIKQEYSKHGTMADSMKIPITEDGKYMNIWNFQVSIPVPASSEDCDNQCTRYDIVEEFTDIDDFLVWYIREAKKHDAAQTKAKAADSTMMNVDVCHDCYRPRSSCSCFTPQSAEDDATVTDGIIDFLKRQHLSPYLKCKFYVASRILEHQANDFDFMSELTLDIRYFIFCIMTCWFFGLLHCVIVSPKFALLLYLGLSVTIYFGYVYLWVIIAYICMWRYGDLWKLAIARRVCSTDLECARLIFRLAGHALHQTIYSNKSLRYLVGFLSSATVVAALYRLWAGESMQSQVSVGAVPKPENNEKPTFYYHDPYKPTSVDISGESKCAQGDILLQKLTRSTGRFNIRLHDYPGKVFSTTAVNFRGNLWLFNKHAYRGGSGTVDVLLEDCSQNVSRNVFGIAISPSDIKLIKDVDLAVIEIKAIPPGPNLVPYFPRDKIIEGRYSGKYVMRDRSGTITCLRINDLHSGTCPVFGIPGYHGKVNVDTQNGDCGSICLADVNGSQVLLGSHTCGKTGKIFLQHVSQRTLDTVLSTYAPQVECGVISISAPGFERKLGPIHQKSSVRFLESGTVGVIGSFVGYRAKHKSKVTRTYIHTNIVSRGYSDAFGPPAMDWRPWHIAIKDMTAHPHSYDNSIMKLCEDAFFDDIMRGVGDKLGMLEVYTLDVSLNGADGVTYVDQINKSTSAGNPFKRSKKHFISVDELGRITHVDDVIMDRIGAIEETYAAGKRFHPQFCAHLKDDPMPLPKVQSGKTRVFVGGEFAWMLVVRRYFLSHVRLIQNNPYVFEAMPGIVAQSKEWDELHKYVTHFGDHTLVGGDYKCFDKKMSAAFVLAAFNILIRMAEAAKWDPSDIQVLRCIAYDTAYFEVDFNGDLLQVQGNPSGHPLTVIINCLVNSLYMRYAYHIVSGFKVNTFQSNVKLATYGDDNLMSVSPNCSKFNHTRIAFALKLIGVEYTMADKDSESVPYISINQATFLKRSFRYDSHIGVVVGPLDGSSFDKMLTTCVRSPSLCPEAHSICVIETAQREYFFHGRDVFQAKQQMFRDIVLEASLEDWVRDSTFPSYESLIREFWIRSGDEAKAVSQIQLL